MAQRTSDAIDIGFTSRLKSVLQSGRFAVTCELGPPQGSTVEPLVHKAEIVKGFVDAANLTDCTGAMVRLSSLASSLAVMRVGLEPVMQMTLRDRNRIGLQSDLLGASALGVRNILCLYGDLPSVSPCQMGTSQNALLSRQRCCCTICRCQSVYICDDRAAAETPLAQNASYSRHRGDRS